MKPQVLIAGVGNIFKGDDAFGVEVAQRLSRRAWGDSVQVRDFGIRGLDLAYALLDEPHDLIILVDAVQRGREPGTLYLIEPDLECAGSGGALLAEAHGMHPAQVFGWVRAMGGSLKRVRLVGCEPRDLGSDEDFKMGLSAPVQQAVTVAVKLVEELVQEAQCMS